MADMTTDTEPEKAPGANGREVSPGRVPTASETKTPTHPGETTSDVTTTTTQTKTPSPPPTEEDEQIYPKGLKLVLIICSLCLAVFLVALDQTIIAPALGAITGEFASVKDIGWYGASYLLSTTALQPSYGSLYRMFSVKWVYLAAIFIFELGSLVCALAPTSNAFIVGRAVAGMGTAGCGCGPDGYAEWYSESYRGVRSTNGAAPDRRRG